MHYDWPTKEQSANISMVQDQALVLTSILDVNLVVHLVHTASQCYFIL